MSDLDKRLRNIERKSEDIKNYNEGYDKGNESNFYSNTEKEFSDVLFGWAKTDTDKIYDAGYKRGREDK